MQDASSEMVFAALFITLILLIIGGVLLSKSRRYKAYIDQKKSQLDGKTIAQVVQKIQADKADFDAKAVSGREAHRSLKEVLRGISKEVSFIKVGLTPPTFSFDDSEKLKSEITACRSQQYDCAAKGDATNAYSNWDWFGSAKDGKQMVSDYRLLLLQAFNAEFESIRKQMRAATYENAKTKLFKLKEQLSKLGETANVSISVKYLNLKLQELKTWHNELLRKEKLKEERKAQKAKLREQNKLNLEDTEELDEEISVRESELKKARAEAEKLAGPDKAKLELLIEKIQVEKAELEEKFSRATSQAQITRAGYIYVISNHGCFGEDIVKIGMTRRLEPMDRVNELGNASVPFKFDVHAMAYVEDAPTIERALHAHFGDSRVNTENHRKEFFRVAPEAVKDTLEQMSIETDWYLQAEAREFQESTLLRSTLKARKQPKREAINLPDHV